MDTKRIDLLRKNAPSVFVGFAALKIRSLNEELNHLRLKYKDASEEEKPFIKSKGEELKEEIQYYTDNLEILTFS